MSEHIAAGLLMCRRENHEIEFFLVHPGGPFYKNKDLGVWSIPKGIPEGDEELLSTAQREFNEETGLTPHPPFHYLGTVQQKGGKIVHAWTFMGDWNAEDGITCNTFTMEWPPKSGRAQEFPEQDRAEWMNLSRAREHINPAQIPLLEKAISFYTENPG